MATTAPSSQAPVPTHPGQPTNVMVPSQLASKQTTVHITAQTPLLQSTVPPSTVAATLAGSKVTMPSPSVKKQVMTSLPSAPITPNKSKKKKKTTVTMATAASASQGGPGSQGENTGRWTAEEHRLFLQGLEQHGKGWKKIASLIKSRTVVQIRTHAQKYFQKLAKARQNGEEGDVSMEGRGGLVPVSASAASAPSAKRRRTSSGTKRKALTSVVLSAQREGKKLAANTTPTGVPCPVPPLPAVAPALTPFVVSNGSTQPTTTSTDPQVPAVTTSHGALSGPALEDSLFRFLTPAPISPPTEVQVNEVARQAGAHPITLPADNPSGIPTAVGGEVSPTAVTDVAIFPSWTDAKDMPTWYAKGADVDCLLDEADTLDWLTDTGDLHETYEPPKNPVEVPKPPNALTTEALAGVVGENSVVPPLPSLFDGASEPPVKKIKVDSSVMAVAPPPVVSASSHLGGDIADEHLNVFDTPMEEHAFVSALLENNGESTGSLLQ